MLELNPPLIDIVVEMVVLSGEVRLWQVEEAAQAFDKGLTVRKFLAAAGLGCR